MQRRGKHVRLFKSGENDAHKIFKELSKQGKIYFKDEEKIQMGNSCPGKDVGKIH